MNGIVIRTVFASCLVLKVSFCVLKQVMRRRWGLVPEDHEYSCGGVIKLMTQNIHEADIGILVHSHTCGKERMPLA